LSEASTARQRAGELETAFDSYARALESFQNQDFPAVIETLEPVVKKVPRFTTGLSLLALAYQKAGDSEKSLAVYKKLLEQDPTLESAVQNSVWIKVDQEDLSGALDLLNTSGGGGIDGHLIRGYQRLLEEDWEAALREFQFAQAQYPLHPRILRQISLCLEEMGRSSDALKVLENAYSAYPEDPGIHQDARRIRFNYGLKLEGERQWKQAEKIFERLHLEEPDNPDFLFHLAYCLQNQDQFQNALQHYFNGLQLGSDSDWVRMNLAYCHTALKQYPEASVQWRILVGRTKKPEYEYHYGLSLVREWKLEEGWSMVRKSARNGYEPAQRLLSRAGLDSSYRK